MKPTIKRTAKMSGSAAINRNVSECHSQKSSRHKFASDTTIELSLYLIFDEKLELHLTAEK